jgi:hypothetical protein
MRCLCLYLRPAPLPAPPLPPRLAAAHCKHDALFQHLCFASHSTNHRAVALSAPASGPRTCVYCVLPVLHCTAVPALTVTTVSRLFEPLLASTAAAPPQPSPPITARQSARDTTSSINAHQTARPVRLLLDYCSIAPVSATGRAHGRTGVYQEHHSLLEACVPACRLDVQPNGGRQMRLLD